MPTSKRRSPDSSTRGPTSRRPCGSSGRFWLRPPAGSTRRTGGTSWTRGGRWSTSPRARWTTPTWVACSSRPSRRWPGTTSWWWPPPAGPTPNRCAPALPTNVRLERFIPHDRLLPHVDVMVTNGGYGGVQQALAHGVPLVVAGDSEDKPEVAARVRWSGAGIDLRTGRPSPGRVAEAVRRVVTRPAYAARARALQAEIAAHPSPRHHRRGAPRPGRSAGRRLLGRLARQPVQPVGPVGHSASEETPPATEAVAPCSTCTRW